MRAVVLDIFSEGTSKGVLCRVNFSDYIENLPDRFKDYFVQRGITTNRYLDNLWETIVDKKHIPMMVLVAEGEVGNPDKNSEIELGRNWNILDGLQRTHRMKLLYQVVQFQIKNIDLQLNLIGDPLSVPQVVKQNRQWLQNNNCTSSLFAKILKTKRSMDPKEFSKIFEDVNLWLEVWFGLNDNEQIQKMLILNAGHKSVNIKHQIELLFSDFLPVLKGKLHNCEIVREKDISSIAYSKSRKPGQFHFSHLVTAFQSLDAGKPVSTNADYAAEKSLSMSTNDDSKLEINIELLEAFAEFLRILDLELRYDGHSIKWLGREVVLAGIFGAIGKHSIKRSETKTKTLSDLRDLLPMFSKWMKLDEFEDARNGLNLAKVNIGNKNKFAVQNATLQFLNNPNGPSPDWRNLFEGESSYDL